jgi:hypothetical protein
MLVQVTGEAVRFAAGAFRRGLTQSPQLYQVLLGEKVLKRPQLQLQLVILHSPTIVRETWVLQGSPIKGRAHPMSSLRCATSMGAIAKATSAASASLLQACKRGSKLKTAAASAFWSGIVHAFANELR